MVGEGNLVNIAHKNWPPKSLGHLYSNFLEQIQIFTTQNTTPSKLSGFFRVTKIGRRLFYNKTKFLLRFPIKSLISVSIYNLSPQILYFPTPFFLSSGEKTGSLPPRFSYALETTNNCGFPIPFNFFFYVFWSPRTSVVPKMQSYGFLVGKLFLLVCSTPFF